MRALVTGVAGFIGSHLTERLLSDGAEVAGLDCFTDYYSRQAKERNLEGIRRHERFRFVETSLQEADLATALDGVTHVFHLAAQAGVRRSWGQEFGVYASHNIEATQRLLEACVSANLSRLVYASSSSVYGDDVPLPMREDALPRPVSPYGVTKLAAEQLCYLYHVSYGLPTIALRYFTVYGPRQRPDMAFHRFLKAAIEGAPLTLYGDGTQTRDFTFVSDAVSATVSAASQGRPGGVYNIGGGSRLSMNEVLLTIERLCGRPLAIHREPNQRGDMRDTYADTTAARQDLGFVPRVTLEDGLSAEYDWLVSGSGCSAGRRTDR
jgi:nucleoside-diphosphate-sugar epimerase